MMNRNPQRIDRMVLEESIDEEDGERGWRLREMASP
jgi:hypothetical protein